MVWVEPVTTTKLLGYPHSREFCAEGLLGRHALGVLGRTLYKVMYLVHVQTVLGCVRVEEHELEFPAVRVFQLFHSHHGSPPNTTTLSHH